MERFQKDRSRSTGRQAYCARCMASMNNAAYQKKKLERRANRAATRKRATQWLLDTKAKLGCLICEEHDIACLDFHHVDKVTKDFNIVVAYRDKKVTKYGAFRELRGCVVLCANCHRKHHWAERNGLLSSVEALKLENRLVYAASVVDEATLNTIEYDMASKTKPSIDVLTEEQQAKKRKSPTKKSD